MPILIALLLGIPIQEPRPADPTPTPAVAPTPEAPPVPVGPRLKEPKKTKHVDPKWPENALRAGMDGRVILECTLGLDGRVEEAKVLRGFQALAEAASTAVKKWRYTPTLLEGKAVPVIMTVTVNFKLRKPPSRSDALASMGDPDPEIRWAAVQWLGRYRPITAEQLVAVQAALKDQSELVRGAAQASFERLTAK